MGYKIHPEYTSQLLTQKIVEKMKKSRTTANRTCRPLEVGSPLRLVDVFTRYEAHSIVNKVTIVSIKKHPAESECGEGLGRNQIAYHNQDK